MNSTIEFYKLSNNKMDIKLKEAFEVETKRGAFYTGGNIEWVNDIIYCQTNSSVSLLRIEDGEIIREIGEENSEDADTIQTFTTDGVKIVSSHKSGLLKLWNENGELQKMWKYIHKGPIAKLALLGTSLASGGSDSNVRIWDLDHQACLSSLKGCPGVVSVVKFINENTLVASGDDGNINAYDVKNNTMIISYKAHYSKVTSIVFAHDKEHFVSAGRDKVIILWEFNKSNPIRTISIYEGLEVIVRLPLKFKLPNFKSDIENIYVASGGESGKVRVWDVTNAKEVYCQDNSLVSKAQEGGLSISSLLICEETRQLAIISVEHNIIIHNLKSFACLKQFIGFSDEILDVVFVGKDDTHLAVATNSLDIKLYNNSTNTCQLLKGHTDLVLALGTSRSNPNLLISSGKDNSIRLWLLNDNYMKCVGIGVRHTGSVGSVSLSQTSTNFAVSVSQDTCVKIWDIPKNFNESIINLNCKYTEVAHQKDINCVTVSPNDKIIATASQDKTAKLWTESLSLVGVLRGHKRGIWSIRFSPVDQVVLTSSADCTIKLWSVSDLSCLKTFEGHESSVLRAEFISNGLQIISTGADGLLKLFSIKTSECNATFAEHEGRIWALTVKKDESCLITGGSDSLVIKWKDVTEERQLKRSLEEEELALQEQKLSNYIQNDQYLKALKLALKLDRPFQVLKLIQAIIKKGDTGLADTVKELKNEYKEKLLNCATSWNTNSKHCQAAQLVLNILINELQHGEFRPVGLSKAIEGTLPYTERHFKRLTQLMQDLQFINYTVNCMQPHAKVS